MIIKNDKSNLILKSKCQATTATGFHFQTEGTNGKHAELVSIHSEEESIELLQATADYVQQPAVIH